MKRHIPGLHSRSRMAKVLSKVFFWFASIRLPTAGIRRNRSCQFGSWSLSPKYLQDDHSRVGCTAPNEPSGS
jgi:hypothetical protein